MTRSVGPQIRGGEAAALVRLASAPVECHSGQIDLLLSIDWGNAGRFGPEIRLAQDSIVVADPDGGAVPAGMSVPDTRRIEIPLTQLCKAHPGWRENLIVLGAAGELLGLPADALLAAVQRRFGHRGTQIAQANAEALAAGAAQAAASPALRRPLPAVPRGTHGRWLITGNEAVGLGALRGGVRFVAAYPITPATDLLEWLAPALARTGGTLLQAEDELASINMIIGASYGGVPALTATSGPGLSLMSEAIGLATAAEIPIVVVDVMRGGPSTGIPTKSEQSDLNIALYGQHGDAPHLVLAPQSVADCVLTTQWATALAEHLQTPAIILSDQFLGQARASVERPAPLTDCPARVRASALGQGPYQRYAVTPEGISPMALPGESGGQYTAEGLSHTERGLPTSSAADHVAQLDKRRDKLERFEYGQRWASIEGAGTIAVLTWGSLTGVVREAVAIARAEGLPVKLIAPRLLLPVRPAAMQTALQGVERLLVVEQSHGAQFHRYLRAHYELPRQTEVLHRSGPLTISVQDVLQSLQRQEAA